jgi:hypothetical protein
MQMLVTKMIARFPNVTMTMGGKVKRLLDRGDHCVYLTWLEQQGKSQQITQMRLHKMQQEFYQVSFEEHQRLANQIHQEDGLKIVQWQDPPKPGQLEITRLETVTNKTPAGVLTCKKSRKGILLTAWLEGDKEPRHLTTAKQMWQSWDDIF